jgi:hypothetical protein
MVYLDRAVTPLIPSAYGKFRVSPLPFSRPFWADAGSAFGFPRPDASL